MRRQRHNIWRPEGLILALLIVLGLRGVAAAAAQEQGPATDSVQLVPQIAETTALAAARGIFYRQTLTVTLPTGPALLASSPDGQGWLCTDDQATLHFTAGDRLVLTWTHRFAGTDRRTIVCLPPQRLVLPIPAEYQIVVALEDLHPDAFSSRPYYLVFATSPPPLATTPALTAPLATRAVTQQGSPTAIKTTLPTSGPIATVATPGPAVMFANPSGSPGTQPAGPPGGDRRLVVGLIGAALLGLAMLVVRRRIRRAAMQPALTGILYLFDQETHEARTELLGGRARLGLRRRPLALVEPATPDESGYIAQIWPTATGPVLRADEITPATPLVHDQLYILAGGTVVVRYRSFGGRPPTTDNRRWTMDSRLQ